MKPIHNCKSYGPDRLGQTGASMHTRTYTKLSLRQLRVTHCKPTPQKWIHINPFPDTPIFGSSNSTAIKDMMSKIC